jgi:hypothetical protein
VGGDIEDCSDGDGMTQGVASSWEDMVSSMLASPPRRFIRRNVHIERNLDIHGASEQYM